jgi:hypothetical protein
MIHAHVHFVAAHPEFVRLMHDEGSAAGRACAGSWTGT